MAKRRQEEGGGGSPAWMSTFSDLMNLLLCFFVLLFSMSTIDAAKFEEIAASLAATFSVLPAGGSTIGDAGVLVNSGASQLNALSEYYNNVGLNSEGDITQEPEEDAYEEVQKESLAESERMAEQIQQQLEMNNVASEVEVVATNRYVLLSLSSGILFDSGQAVLKPEAISVIGRVADAIYQYDDNIITIEGHTDSQPISTAQFPNNMKLSMERAYQVYDYLINEKGFDSSSLTSSGRGESVPIASNATLEGRAQNRRVEIKIYNSYNSN